MKEVVKVQGYTGIWEGTSKRKDDYMIVYNQGMSLVITDDCIPIVSGVNTWKEFNSVYKELIPDKATAIEILEELKKENLKEAGGFAVLCRNKAFAIEYAINMIKRLDIEFPDTNYKCPSCNNHKTFKEINVFETLIDQETNTSTDKFLRCDEVICDKCSCSIEI